MIHSVERREHKLSVMQELYHIVYVPFFLDEDDDADLEEGDTVQEDLDGKLL